MHILKTNINGNPNIGLYIYANNEFCLVPSETSESLIKQIEDVLKVKCHKVSVAGSSLLGAFIVGNSKTILLPDIAFEEELQLFDKLKINYKLFKTKLTALGNNILCNDKACIVNPEYSEEEITQLNELLGVKVINNKFANLETPGSMAVINKKGALIFRDASPEDIELIKTELGLDCQIGSVNMGNPFVSIGIVCNDNGFLIGDQSGGPEIQRADEALGFLVS